MTVDDIATILTNVDPGPGLIGVWNIVEAMDGSKTPSVHDLPTQGQTSPSGWTPMPLDLILSRQDLARDLFYHLNVRTSKYDVF